MNLDIGNQKRIDDPTPEQIGDALRNLPADAPFMILNADESLFLQAVRQGDAFRVEWRQETEHRFVVLSPARTEEAFCAFRRWDEPALRTFAWRRSTIFNNPYDRLIFIAILSLAIAAFIIWLAFR